MLDPVLEEIRVLGGDEIYTHYYFSFYLTYLSLDWHLWD